MSPKKVDAWISRGILSACECFSCANKLAHRFKETKIYIHCKDPCNYKPIRGVEKSALDKLEDIEQLV
ncbi:hypothetical protein KEJ21_03605 [Candidatus Bathyarchaeota archaeon]|nr:hypothetical protein [Candidatus Bathyarchaeota archaeon]MBS7630428.1 hypothetical protein [Candidatus Bathyarchaeota archaeon]